MKQAASRLDFATAVTVERYANFWPFSNRVDRMRIEFAEVGQA